MGNKLLTIAIPTYNRADSLALLLGTLSAELAGLDDCVDVIIGDNASTDRTPNVTATFQSAWPAARVIRHPHNLGAEENFCQCIDRMSSRFFWIIGDDDLPCNGAIRKVVDLLEHESPDLVCLASEWAPRITGPAQGGTLGTLHPRVMDRIAFAGEVNVWLTFISGMVVNRALLTSAQPPLDLRRYVGTSLPQLAWVLGAMQLGTRFVYVADRCVLATSGNTGGYAVMKVFGANFTQIVRENFGTRSEVTRAILGPHLTGYLPQLIWDTRFRSVGAFQPERGWSTLREALGDSAAFWLLITPMIWSPKPLARAFLLVSRVVRRAGLEWTRWRHRRICLTRVPLVKPVEPSAGDRAR